ncbi:hypothetical protein AC1031_013425 [Aphanomyces cochlioides]|nr:hypothetical protein AC1031_013425 [Aphanomyces cochlioides]
MASSRYPSSKAVILLGGHEDRHFRPLSMDQPTPLFPIAGRPMLYHHVEACSKVPNLKEILLIGAYDSGLFASFMDIVTRDIQVPIRYLQERQHLGTGGGLRTFRNDIEDGQPELFYVLHYDICCSFPLLDMLHSHIRAQAFVTVLGKRVYPDEAKTYGCMVADPDTSEVIHWAEKPSTFVSDLINCGVYLLNIDMLQDIVEMGDALVDQREKAQLRSAQYPQLFHHHMDKLRLVNCSSTNMHDCAVGSSKTFYFPWLARSSCLSTRRVTFGARSRRQAWLSCAPSSTCSDIDTWIQRCWHQLEASFLRGSKVIFGMNLE